MSKLPYVAIVTLSCLAAEIATAQQQVEQQQQVAQPQQLEKQLTVQLTSGRKFSGALDAGSTREQLVLRSSAGGITIRRPIQWERIAAASVDGQTVAVTELRAGISSQVPGARGQPIKTIVLRGPPTPLMDLAELTPQPPAPLPQVSSIAFDAFIANWDGDVEIDGLVVDLLPLDASGSLIRAAGTVEVELFAMQRRTLSAAPQSGGRTLERVERWSQAVNPIDIGPSGIRLRLPFGQVHPELDPDWLAYNYGLVHVRFIAPGSGVFDDSRDGIRIRPWAPNRDYLEMNTGRRFLPTENLGRRN